MDIYKINDIEELIKDNSYVGRGIVIGKTEDGSKACAAYFIMGRSANSRNRVFTLKNGELFMEPFDPSKVEDIDEHGRRKVAPTENMGIPVSIYLVEQE